MTLDEAIKLGKIIGTADGGCSNCVGLLVELANKEFPEFNFTTGNEIDGIFDDDYGWLELPRIDVIVKEVGRK